MTKMAIQMRPSYKRYEVTTSSYHPNGNGDVMHGRPNIVQALAAVAKEQQEK